MKTKLFCFLVLLIAFSGCDKIKDAATIKVPTNLKTDIHVDVTAVGMKSFDLIALNSGSFSTSKELALAANDSIASYLDRFKAIDINAVTVSIPSLGSEQKINTLVLNVTGVGDIFTQTNITSSLNNPFNPVYTTAGILDEVAKKLTDERKITLTVSGTTTGLTTFNVGLTIGADVIVYAIN